MSPEQQAARDAAIDEAARIAQADTIAECPYSNDRPGDPTWNHTDDDVCPVCRVTGHDSLNACVGVARNRIAAAIHTLRATPPPAAPEITQEQARAAIAALRIAGPYVLHAVGGEHADCIAVTDVLAGVPTR